MTTDPCTEFLPLIVRAADDAIGADDRARFDRHVETCAACRAALSEQREARGWLAARLPVEASPALRVRIRTAIDVDVEQRAGVPAAFDFRRWTWRLLPVAAVCLVAVLWGTTRSIVAVSSNTAVPGAASDTSTPVSSALFSEDLSDVSILSLMLNASADDALANHVKEAGR